MSQISSQDKFCNMGDYIFQKKMKIYFLFTLKVTLRGKCKNLFYKYFFTKAHLLQNLISQIFFLNFWKFLHFYSILRKKYFFLVKFDQRAKKCSKSIFLKCTSKMTYFCNFLVLNFKFFLFPIFLNTIFKKILKFWYFFLFFQILESPVNFLAWKPIKLPKIRKFIFFWEKMQKKTIGNSKNWKIRKKY